MNHRPVAALAVLGAVATVGLLRAQPAAAPVPATAPAGTHPFVVIHKVFTSPRCLNCHPSGDRPLQTDQSLPHTQQVSRKSAALGLPCASCHREKPIAGVGMPPGAPHWQLPPAETPMVFQGRSVQQLCEQLRDPAHSGGRSVAALVEHVRSDPLVLWGWSPGEGRTPVPVSHAETVAALEAWKAMGGACPLDKEPWVSPTVTSTPDAGPAHVDGGNPH